MKLRARWTQLEDKPEILSYKSKLTGRICRVFKNIVNDDNLMRAIIGNGFKIDGDGKRYTVSELKVPAVVKPDGFGNGGFTYDTMMKPIKNDAKYVVQEFEEDYNFMYDTLSQEKLDEYYEVTSND